MTPKLLDTDVLVEYLRGGSSAIRFLESLAGRLLVSVITVTELYAGVRHEEEEGRLDQFFLAFDVLDITGEIARLAGRYRREYHPSHGTGLADALIAATAVTHEADFVTFNARHFPMLESIQVPYARR